MLNKLERENFDIIYYKNGITEIALKDNVVIDLKDSIEQEQLLLKHMPENGYLILVTTGPGTSVTRDSREYANEHPLKARAMAVIAKSLPQKIIVNFMITVYRKKLPDYPVKLFVKKEKAQEWLLHHQAD